MPNRTAVIILAAVLLAACSSTRSRLTWEDASRQNSLLGYENYMSQNPEGIHHDEAAKRSDELRLSDAKKANRIAVYEENETKWHTQEAATAAREAARPLSCQRAIRDASIASYGSFLNRYPEDPRAEDLQRRSDQLKRFDATRLAVIHGDTMSLDRVIGGNPELRATEWEDAIALAVMAAVDDYTMRVSQTSREFVAGFKFAGLQKARSENRERCFDSLKWMLEHGARFASIRIQGYVPAGSTFIELAADEKAYFGVNFPHGLAGGGKGETLELDPSSGRQILHTTGSVGKIAHAPDEGISLLDFARSEQLAEFVTLLEEYAAP